MIIFFFQNCISPHQLPFISELPNQIDVEKVVVVSPMINNSKRKEMGWDVQKSLHIPNVEFVIQPSHSQIQKLYEKFAHENTYCIYSGISSFSEVFAWFKIGLQYKIQRGIITERPNTYWYKPIWLHYVRFQLFDRPFFSYINYIFAIGDLAVEFYDKLYKDWKIIPFAYCTRNIAIDKNVEIQEDQVRLVYVGTVNKNKNVIAILQAMTKLNIKNLTLDIIGDGPEKKKLEFFCSKNDLADRVNFHGFMNMEVVHQKLSEFDVLILPSKYDGWGAVVNEGLQKGLYVICSTKCGAQSLLSNREIGCIFNSQIELNKCLEMVFSNRKKIKKQKMSRKLWSECISGQSLAKYFIDSLNRTVIEPWKEAVI